MSLFWIYAAGVYAIGFGVFHIAFWKIFRWKKDLPGIHPINQGIMQVMNICLIYIFFLVMGMISLFYPRELQTTGLGHSLLRLFAGFWLFRSILQVLFFNRKSLISWVYTAVFLLGALLNGVASL